MSSCLTPTTVKTYPSTTSQSGACTMLADWQDCDSCGGDFEGYSKTDAPVTYCVNGVMMIGQSLTDDPNKDNPFYGAYSVTPATWSIMTLSQWMGTKQDQLTGSDGNPVASGTCVPTCVELDAVSAAANAAQDAADQAQSTANNKQDQLVDSNGNPVAAGTCVPTCAELDAVEAKADATQSTANNKQDQLVDSGGNPVAAGTCVPTCAELNAVSDEVVTSGAVTGTDIVLSKNNGGTVTIDASGLSGGGGGADGVVSSGTVTGTDIVLSTSTGGTVTIDASSLAGSGGGGGSDGVVSSGTVTGTDIVLSTSTGGTVTIDASSLAGGGGGVTALSGCIDAGRIECGSGVMTNTILYAHCHQTDTTSCTDGDNTVGPAPNSYARIL